jgi:hypothetical protein
VLYLSEMIPFIPQRLGVDYVFSLYRKITNSYTFQVDPFTLDILRNNTDRSFFCIVLLGLQYEFYNCFINSPKQSIRRTADFRM